MEQTNDKSLEDAAINTFGKPHKWQKKLDQNAWFARIMQEYQKKSYIGSPELPEYAPTYTPVGKTSEGKDIFQWTCLGCGETTYSDEPCPGECSGRQEMPGTIPYSQWKQYQKMSGQPGQIFTTGAPLRSAKTTTDTRAQVSMYEQMANSKTYNTP